MRLLFLVLAALPWGADLANASPPAIRRPAVCWVTPVREARTAPGRIPAYSAAQILSVRFRALVRHHPGAPSRPVVQLRVYAPNGDLYDVLEVTTTGSRTRGLRRGRLAGTARLPVAGSGIINSSLYGRWTVVPHLEGEEDPCGHARRFELQPRVAGSPFPGPP